MSDWGRLSYACSTNRLGGWLAVAIGALFVCVVDGGILTYRTVAAVARACCSPRDRTLFVGLWSHVCHRGCLVCAQLAFRLCSKAVRTIRFQSLKTAYGNLA